MVRNPNYFEKSMNLTKRNRSITKIEYKIISAIEKLVLLFRSLLWDLAKKEGVSPIQIQFLLYLKTHSAELCRVSQLAKEFSLSKATVSESMNSLNKKGLVKKKVMPQDRRVSIFVLAPSGKKLNRKLFNWAGVILGYIGQFPLEVKKTVAIFLMELIESLHRAGIIPVARICITCANFQKNIHPGTDRPHHCRLIDKPVAGWELRFDCSNYREKLAYKPIDFWN